MRKSTCLFLILIMLSLLAGCRAAGGGAGQIGAGAAGGGAGQVGAGAAGGGAGTAGPDAAGGPAEPSSIIQNDPLWTDAGSMKAMVISDLHYTEYKEVDPMIVPGVAVAEEITDAIVAEVIDRHPDVLIMTGDNTNSGYSRDVAGLTAKLQKVRNAGVQIVLTTGNHDMDLMGAEEFEEAYFGLLDPVDRDPASLSYTAIVKDVVFLAMDDNAVNPGGQGEFSSATMRWLAAMLSKYSSRQIIFLSHHNVLYGYGDRSSASNLIQSPSASEQPETSEQLELPDKAVLPELPDLLREGGVKLAMTGHMHFPYVTEEGGLWEILSGMPFSGRHLIGRLAVGSGRAVYFAEPVDFEVYGGAVKEELARLDRESAAYMSRVFGELLGKEGLWGPRKKRALRLIGRYMQYYGEGTLAEHAQELRDDPSCELMIKSLWNYNYGPWMKAMLETTKYSARELEVSW